MPIASPSRANAARVAQHYRIAIRGGRLPAGASLPTADTIADQLNATRSAVLTALRLLAADGLILVGRGRLPTRVAERAPRPAQPAPRAGTRSPRSAGPGKRLAALGLSMAVSIKSMGCVRQSWSLRRSVPL